MARARAARAEALAAGLAAKLGGGVRFAGAAREWLGTRGCSRPLALRLLAAARGEWGDAWEARRAAALMLQEQVLGLPAGEILRALGVCDGRGRIPESVLAEGYTSTEPEAFARQFRRRLARSRGALRRARAGDLDVARLSRKEPKLALARYTFTPEEVVERILGQVKTSRGVPEPFPEDPPWLRPEVEHALSLLPPYEAEIFRRLRQGFRIYWVAGHTGSEINGLVEYPLTTVVLVIKPPGSDLEFEIKRAGCRQDLPFGVVFERGGEPVPPSHRLQGGSMVKSLLFDASASSLLAAVFRAAHGGEAPMAATLSAASVYGVPVNGHEAHVLDYFTERRHFGGDYGGMRRALRQSIEAFREEWDRAASDLPGDLGTTLEFLSFVTPGQAILAGSSSFRLDRVALYLSPEGPAAYLGGPEDARELADEVLEEVLGVYDPPDLPYRDHGEYVAAALARPANRARADRTFLSLARQIGTFWGTLYAVRGYTNGESFVARNVGLKSRWRGGRWTVDMVFMDHDDMRIGRRDRFEPGDSLPGIHDDYRYIVGDGRNREPDGLGEMGYLREIYQVSPEVAGAGQAALREAARRAYGRTGRVLSQDKNVRNLFRRSFLSESKAWDEAVRAFLRGGEGWPARIGHRLAPKRAASFRKALESHAGFLRAVAFLYGTE